MVWAGLWAGLRALGMLYHRLCLPTTLRLTSHPTALPPSPARSVHTRRMTSHATTNGPPAPPNAASSMTLANYQFPSRRLRQQQQEPDRIPLVLVACGSFSPITFLHLRMFEMANDYARMNTNFEVVGGYLSPVSDAYKKAGLAPSNHRVRMCELATEETSNWLMVDPWEAIQPEYSPTRPTMSTPGVWAEKDLDHILGSFGAMIVERSGTDMEDALANLKPWEENIYVIQQMIQNDVSSTKIRLLLKRDLSITYLIPSPVIQYIMENRLYMDEDAKPKDKQPMSSK
ncbi:hypothetical protein CHU98_g3887 [Xylaria longipes]|nr:hypothetical protein CHU98_g3887 [Xylaria longipes]